MPTKSFFLMFCLCLISACGGGSGGSDTPNSSPVLVNAGADFTLLEGETSDLSGVASGGDGNYSYAWSAPDNIQINHPDTSAAAASIVAPAVTTDTSYTLSLRATDGEGKSGSKTIVMSVTPVNILPEAIIQTNALENYPENSYPVNATITFDASASSDADAQPDAPEIATYLWQQVAGEDVLGEVAKDQPTLTFISPMNLEPTDIDFMLTVTDQEGGEATARVNIRLLGEQGTLPIVDAGKAVSVVSGELLLLYGSSSTEAPRANPLVNLWRHDYDDALIVNNDEQLQTHLIAPLVSTPTDITFELTTTDNFGNQFSDTVTYTVHPPINASINDTGVTQNTNNSSIQTAFLHEYPGQDGHYGSDRIDASGSLKKAGRGDSGFDFTRLNENGDPIDNPALEGSCIRDNTTGLVWESKSTDENSIHYVDNLYTWYQEEGSIGNFEGALNASSTSCSLANGQCNTQALLEQVNRDGRCGFFDWRIPTLQELQSIQHFGRLSAPLADTEYFPLWGSPVGQRLWYWTNQTSADGISDDTARNAWAIDFASGVDNFLNKATEQKVRLVRAGRVKL